MIKKILFITSVFASIFASAQSFKLMDHNDVDITNTTHYEIDDAATLSATKFHIENLTGITKSFAVKVELIYTPYSNSDLQVCFGTACYSASATVSGTQIINGGVGDVISGGGGVIYSDLKVAPVTWMWTDCVNDSAVWKLTIYDSSSPTDSASAIIVWKCDAATSVKELSADDVELSAYPNPAKENLTINYNVKGDANSATLNLYDMLGQEVLVNVLDLNKSELKVNVSSLNPGIYFYAINIDGQVIKTNRVVIR